MIRNRSQPAASSRFQENPLAESQERQKRKKRMAGISSALEVYFATTELDFPPLYYHHIPKTGGTSFRAAVRACLRGSPRLIVPQARRLLDDDLASSRFIELEARCRQFGTVRALMSHYTAHLQHTTSRGILAIVREPEAHFRSMVSFHLDAHRARSRDPRSIARSAANRQMRSLTGIKPPYDPPADLTRWSNLVEQAALRFSLFRLEDGDLLRQHCLDTHGLEVRMQRKKETPPETKNDPLVSRVCRALRRDDPVWWDKMLYAHLTERAIQAEPDGHISLNS